MKSTERISQVLALFTPTAAERSTADIADLCEVAVSTAHDLLNGLAEVGLLRRVAPGRFRLGPCIAQLAATLQSSDTLIEASRVVLVDNAERYGETCHIFVLADGRMISMTSSEGHASVRVARDAITQDVPLHATAPGKLLMSSLPLAELNRMLSGITLATPTSGTVTQKSFLRDQIARIREDDYAEVVGELDPHLASVAAPVRNHSGIIVGAFSYLIPASRFLDQRRAYRNICTEAARKISSRLGWQEPGEDVQHLNGERRRRSKARPTGANTAERISHDRR